MSEQVYNQQNLRILTASREEILSVLSQHRLGSPEALACLNQLAIRESRSFQEVFRRELANRAARLVGV